MQFSLNQCAEMAGMTKSAIYKRIKRGLVSAVRDENGQYFIDAAEFFRAFPEADGAVSAVGNVRADKEDKVRTDQMEKLVYLLERELEFTKNQLLEAQSEKRQLMALLENKSTQVSTPPVDNSADNRPSLMHKLFGRGKG